MTAPLILCHYGDSWYLPYVLKCLENTNPKILIHLLGDESNAHLANKYNIDHHLFSNYHKGDKVKRFDRRYQLIQGKRHINDKGWGRDWINFVFLRWFYINEFIKKSY